MQDAFWTIGGTLLFVIVTGALLLGPWFSICRVQKECSKTYKSRQDVVVSDIKGRWFNESH